MFLDWADICKITNNFMHGLRSHREEIAYTHTPNFLGMAEAYFVCHIDLIFQISLIYAFIGCP